MTKTTASTARSTAASPAKAPAKATAKVVTQPAAKAGAKQRATPPAKARAPASPAGRTAPALGGAATQPSLRFYHSIALRSKTQAVLEALEAAPDQAHHGDAMADLVAELIEAGMDYYFLRALKQAQVGFVAEQSARLGLSGAVKLISSVSRKFILRMDKHQLLFVAQHLRELA